VMVFIVEHVVFCIKVPFINLELLSCLFTFDFAFAQFFELVLVICVVFQIFVMGIVPDTTAEIEDQILGQDVYRTRRTIFLVRPSYFSLMPCQFSAIICHAIIRLLFSPLARI
jgi:hypothetical protein